MNKSIIIAMLGLSIVVTAGCANGPVRRFFSRGAACNACQPALGQSLWGGEDDDSPCSNGHCPAPDQGADTVIPNTSGGIYGQPNFDPFSGGQIVNPPANIGTLPGPAR